MIPLTWQFGKGGTQNTDKWLGGVGGRDGLQRDARDFWGHGKVFCLCAGDGTWLCCTSKSTFFAICKLYFN